MLKHILSSQRTFALVLLLFSARILAQTTGAHWVGSWATAPTQGTPNYPLTDATVRQTIHVSLTGNSLRIHLSNHYGTTPVVVDDVHIARSSGDSSLVGGLAAGTDRTLQFGGQRKVILAAGQEAVSDAAEFPLAAESEVAVSLHLITAPSPCTWHASAFQTNYVTSGDHAADATLSHATPIRNYLLLTGLDVEAPESVGALVAFGASITDGYSTTPNLNLRWPDDLARRAVRAGITLGVLNLGIAGNRLLVDGAGASALKRFDHDAAAQPGVRWVIFADDPINDLGSTKPQPTAAELIAALQQMITHAHALHLKFLCSTLTPYEGAGYWNASGEAARQRINDFLRSPASGCDALVDQDAATHDPQHPTRYLPAYDSGDHLHPNNAGMQAIADAVPLEQLVRD